MARELRDIIDSTEVDTNIIESVKRSGGLEISDTDGLQAELDSKSPIGHTHPIDDISDFPDLTDQNNKALYVNQDATALEFRDVTNYGSVSFTYIFDPQYDGHEPAEKHLKLNSDNYTTVTEILVHEHNYNSNSLNTLTAIKVGDILVINDVDTYNGVSYTVNADPIDNGTWWTIPVDFRSYTGNMLQNELVNFGIIFQGVSRWGEITGLLSDQTDLQSALDGKVSITGDTVFGDIQATEGARFTLEDTVGNGNKAALYLNVNGELEVANLGNTVLTLTNDGRLLINGDEIGAGGHAEWGNITGMITKQTDLMDEFNKYFKKDEFVDVSVGAGDAGKPIVLAGTGKIDPSMIDYNTFYYVGPHDPSDVSEYPDTSSESPGAFWVVEQIANPDDPDADPLTYTFTSGDLNGQTIDIGNFMVWSNNGWWIMKSSMNPTMYYKLDGSNPITADFKAGGFKISNMANGVVDSDGATMFQLMEQVPRDGSRPLTGPLDAGGFQLKNILNASEDGDAVNLKQYNEHSLNNNNPHKVTADQAGALPTTGGIMTGAIEMSRNNINHALSISLTNDGTHQTELLVEGITTNLGSYYLKPVDSMNNAADLNIGDITASWKSVNINAQDITYNGNPFVVSDIDTAGGSGSNVTNIIKCTQAEYDGMTHDAETFYIIIG